MALVYQKGIPSPYRPGICHFSYDRPHLDGRAETGLDRCEQVGFRRLCRRVTDEVTHRLPIIAPDQISIVLSWTSS
jgi:hypothetical protein